MAIPGGASGAVSGNLGAREVDLAGAQHVADQKAAPAHGRHHGEKQRKKRDGDGGDGRFVINSKFQNSSL